MREQEHDMMRAVEDHHWWYRILRSLVLEALSKRLLRGASILDAGCGTGGMMVRLNDFSVHGIDESALAVKHCFERGLQQVQVASVHDLPFGATHFNAVLSLDVLYHSGVDEHRALAEMVRVLKPGGLLVMNVPAFECLRGSHDLAVCGVRRYRWCHVQRMLLNHSVRIEMMHYWNAWLFLPLLIRRHWSRMHSVKAPIGAASDLQQTWGWLNDFLTIFGTMEAFACRMLRIPFGSSLFIVARRIGNTSDYGNN